MNNSVVTVFAVTLLAGGLVGCLSNTPQIVAGAGLSAAHEESIDSRTVNIQLVADTSVAFVPLISKRTIIAEPQLIISSLKAKGTYQIDGIRAVIIGASCDALNARVATLDSCEESVAESVSYGEPAVSAVTESQGRANLPLERKPYRLTIQPEPTLEDSKCWWGGSVVVPAGSTDAELAMLVYCE